MYYMICVATVSGTFALWPTAKATAKKNKKEKKEGRTEEGASGTTPVGGGGRNSFGSKGGGRRKEKICGRGGRYLAFRYLTHTLSL